MLTAPKATYESVVSWPRWLGMLAITTAITTVVMAAFLFSSAGTEIIREQMMAQGNAQPEQVERMLPIIKGFQVGIMPIAIPVVTVIMAGVLSALQGREVELAHQEVAQDMRMLHHGDHGSSRFRYCTNFAITGSELDSNNFVPRLEQIGDSVLVVGDAHTLRVHVHTDDPQLAVAVFDGAGEVSRLDVADMREQVAERDKRLGAVVMEASPAGSNSATASAGSSVCTCTLSVRASPTTSTESPSSSNPGTKAGPSRFWPSTTKLVQYRKRLDSWLAT